MTKESKIIWEPEWPHGKSHAFIPDISAGAGWSLCGLPISFSDSMYKPPEEKRCKRCLKILAQKGRMMAINDPRQLILTKAPEFNSPWPDELRGWFDWSKLSNEPKTDLP